MPEELPPDPYLHKMMSFWKSGLRIVACTIFCAASVSMGFRWFAAGSYVLGMAEVLGVIEELV